MTGQSRKLADCTDGLSQFCADVDVCIDNGVDVDELDCVGESERKQT